jgi:hypothetical protein
MMGCVYEQQSGEFMFRVGIHTLLSNSYPVRSFQQGEFEYRILSIYVECSWKTILQAHFCMDVSMIVLGTFLDSRVGIPLFRLILGTLKSLLEAYTTVVNYDV